MHKLALRSEVVSATVVVSVVVATVVVGPSVTANNKTTLAFNKQDSAHAFENKYSCKQIQR